MAAAAASAAAAVVGGHSPTMPTSAFGGAFPVHIAKVGHIDVDLESDGRWALRQLPCVGASDTTVCYSATTNEPAHLGAEP